MNGFPHTVLSACGRDRCRSSGVPGKPLARRAKPQAKRRHLSLPSHPAARPGASWIDFSSENGGQMRAPLLLTDGCLISGNANTQCCAASRGDRTPVRIYDDRRCSVQCRTERSSMRMVRPQPPGRLWEPSSGLSPDHDRRRIPMVVVTTARPEHRFT
jgi:hypothetical protein